MNIEIILSESQIEALINGETVSKRTSIGHVVDIRQSYIKDATAPILKRRNKVVDTETQAVMNKHFAKEVINSYYRDEE